MARAIRPEVSLQLDSLAPALVPSIAQHPLPRSTCADDVDRLYIHSLQHVHHGDRGYRRVWRRHISVGVISRSPRIIDGCLALTIFLRLRNV